MDVKLGDVPTIYTASTLKSALRAAIANVDNKFQSDFLVFVDYNTEKVLWDSLAGKPPFATGILVLPDPELAKKLCGYGSIKIQYPPPSTLTCIITLAAADPQLTFDLEYKKLASSKYKPDEETSNSEWNGAITQIRQIQCGLFTESRLVFDHAAEWKPTEPFNWLSFYGDSSPRKFETGIHYAKGAKPDLWIGEWIAFNISDISHIVIPPTKETDVIYEMYLLLDKPPYFYQRNTTNKDSAGDFRASRIQLDQNVFKDVAGDDKTLAPLQYSRVYRLLLADRPKDRPPLTPALLKSMLPELQPSSPKLALSYLVVTPRNANPTLFNYNHFTAVQQTAGNLPLNQSLAYNRLLTNGFLTPWALFNLNPKISALFTKAATENKNAVEFIEFITKKIGKSHIRALPNDSGEYAVIDNQALDLLYDDFAALPPPPPPKKGREEQMKLYKVVVYPSHHEIREPEFTESNRILRQYSIVADRFLLVAFQDKGTRIFATESDTESLLLIDERVSGFLKRKLEIGGRQYEFLGFSNSGLREKKVWFFLPTPELNAESIRNGIGQWDPNSQLVKSPSKWSARIALAFSSTTPVAALTRDQWTVIPDTSSTVNRHDYIFTDGIGMIRPSLQKIIHDKLREKNLVGEQMASAYQIRFGGAKGVVCVAANKAFAEYDPKIQMVLRDSMVKFQPRNLDSLDLEISTAAESRAKPTFNKILLKLMEGYFYDNPEVIGYIRSLYVAQAAAIISKGATGLDVTLGLVQRTQFIQGLSLPQIVYQFGQKKIGWKDIEGSFLYQAILNLLADQLKLAKFDFSVPIPESYAGMGVIDEYDLLQPGEVFVRINGNVITGNVLVYRNPLVHPGDAQLAKALSRMEVLQPAMKAKKEWAMDALVALDNVVVFSKSRANDARPLPNMLSGGDLDGDLYCVLAPASRLVPPKEKIASPAMYDAETAATLDSAATVIDISNFVGKFTRYDCMALLSSLQLVVSDRVPQGLWLPDSLELSRLLSQAVDFQKSGNQVDIQKEIEKHPAFAARRRPDFMKKAVKQSPTRTYRDDPRHEYYESPGLLGTIFRQADEGNFAAIAVDNTNNSKLAAALAKYAPPSGLDKNLMAQIQGRIDKELYKYRIELWNILRRAQKVGIATYESDLFVLPAVSQWDETAVRDIKAALQMLLKSTAWSLQISEDPQILFIGWWLAWETIKKKLPPIQIMSGGPVPENFGMSFAFLRLGDYLQSAWQL